MSYQGFIVEKENGTAVVSINMPPILRTGDLGFLSDGQLFVTGRVKDVIIIRGRNYYPQDIEATAETSHEALSCAGGAAFSVEREGAERLVIVLEVDRQHRKADFKEVIRAVRREVSCQLEVDVYSGMSCECQRCPLRT